MILKSYLHIKTRHLVKIIPTTPTCFSLSRPSSGSFVLPYFVVANASMLNIWYCSSMSVINIPCNINVSGVLYSTPSLMQHIFIMAWQIPLGLLTCAGVQLYIVYFICQLFYVFRVVSPPIIRSTNNYLQHLVLVNRCCSNGWLVPDAK